MSNKYDHDLDRNPANYAPLTPVHFLEHAAKVYPEKTAVVHGDYSVNYVEFHRRSRLLASALRRRGIGRGDTVSIIAPNIPAHLEAHFGVPMCGAVLNSINIRLDAATVAYILEHAECDVLLVDAQFVGVAVEALQQVRNRPLVLDIDDPEGPSVDGIGDLTYEEFLLEGDAEDRADTADTINDEWQALSLNYTSGTTGNPKGVVYHHRGAYLNAIGNTLAFALGDHPVYLWTLPMFHCNGWCFPWTITLKGGTHVCLREVAAEPVIRSLHDHNVTHMCGAPIVLSTMLSAPDDFRRLIPAGLKVMMAGAPPPAPVISEAESLGVEITHTYGLTEVYGPCVYCAWREDWGQLPSTEQAALKARQGVPYPVLSGLDVFDPVQMEPVPADGETMGEVMFRGNVVMKGYLKDSVTTAAAFAAGWFHSGDIAVKHADGYLEIKDRSKDIIISGGENISSIEVESALYKHQAVLAVAVVAKKDEKWGETPCAFVQLKEGEVGPSTDELREFCRQHLASFKLPKYFVFGELPKTSTGKVQKFLLRQRANDL